MIFQLKGKPAVIMDFYDDEYWQTIIFILENKKYEAYRFRDDYDYVRYYLYESEVVNEQNKNDLKKIMNKLFDVI